VGAPVFLFPRFPDNTLCDLFLWGYVKDYVYRTSMNDSATFLSRIVEALRSVVERISTRLFAAVGYVRDVIRASRGSHAEVKLKTHTLFQLKRLHTSVLFIM
jgi:hypothetical protein